MAKELTANFGANTTKFSAGMQKIRTELTNLNKAFDENQRVIAKTNKEIKSLEKQQEELQKEINDSGKATDEQKNKMLQLSTAIAQAKANVAGLKTEQASLKADIKSTTSKLTEQNTALTDTNTVGGKVKGMFGELTNAVKGFIAVYGTKKLFEMLIGSNMEMEQFETSFTTMLGSAEKASALISQIKDFTSTAPLTIDDTMGSATMLLNYGVQAENVIDKLRQLGDVALGDAVKLDRITLAYGQMLAKGKVTGEELRQMTEAGVPMTQALADAMGVTTAELSKMISDSKVGISDLDKALTNLTSNGGQFAGLMEKQAQTMQGMLSTLKDNVAEFFRDAGEGAFDELKQTLEDIMAEIDTMKKDGSLAELAQELSVSIANLVKFLKTAISVGWQFRNVILAGVVAIVSYKTAINIGNVIQGTVLAVKSFTNAVKSANAAQAVFNATSAASPWVAVMAAVVALGGAIATFAVANNNATNSVQNLSQKTSQLASEAESVTEKFSSLDEISAKYEEIYKSTDKNLDKKSELATLQEQLNQLYGEEASQIDLVNGSYAEQIGLIDNLSESDRTRAKNKIDSDLQTAIDDKNSVAGISTKVSLDYDDSNGDFLAKKLYEIEQEANKGLGILDTPNLNIDGGISEGGGSLGMVISGDIDTQIDILKKMEQAILDTGDANGTMAGTFNTVHDRLTELTTIQDSVITLTEAQKRLQDGLSDSSEDNKKKTKEQTDSLKEWHEQATEGIITTEQLTKSAKENNSAVSSLTSEYASLCKVFEEQEANGKLSISTVSQMIDKGYGACLTLDEETGAVRLNEQAYRDLIQTKIDVQNASLALERQELNLMNAQLATQAASAAQSRDNTRLLEIQSQITANDQRLAAIAMTSSVYDKILTDPTGKVERDTTNSDKSYYTDAYNAYKTEADKKLELIKRELKAKKELRDETIKAIDDEIEARKKLSQDKDIEDEINAVKAQLKYSQMDGFSKGQLNKKLQGLYDEKSEIQWQRNAEQRKETANSEYETEEKKLTANTESVNASLNTVKQILDSLANGTQNVSNIINNTKNSTANINLANQALSMAQITRAVKDALMDDIII